MHFHRYLVHANHLELYLDLMKVKNENFSREDWTAWMLRVELRSKEVTVYLPV